MKGRQIRYSDEELSFLEWRQAMSRRALHAAFVAHFGRHDIKLDDIKALCSRKGWSTGRDGCFVKGQTPFNKGKPHPARGRAAETQFQKGCMTGAAAAKYKPIGTERFNKDGYLERKIHDGMPLQSRWRLVHVLRWEELNGPVPAGTALKCLDGYRRNTEPSNWRAVPRALLARLAGRYGRDYDNAPSELKPTVLAIAEKGRTKGRRLKYTDAEIAWLRDNSTMEINAWCAAFRAQFGRDDTTPAKLHSLRKREGWKTGRTGQFDKGSVPATKGKKMPFNANSAKTQFKKGQVPHTYRGAGHERTDRHGYTWIVIDQPNPWTGASTWSVHKHRYLWEQANGPVPDGMVLKCLGDKTDTDPANWEPVPIGLLPRLNGKSNRSYDRAPAELKPTIMAVAKLEHAVAARRKPSTERTPT